MIEITEEEIRKQNGSPRIIEALVSLRKDGLIVGKCRNAEGQIVFILAKYAHIV